MGSAIRQVLFFVVLLALPVASYFFVFKPRNEQIEKAKAEIEQKRAVLTKLEEATRQAADLEKANQQIRESIESIHSRLPTSKEMDEVLRQVSGLAAKNTLRVPQFKRNEKSAPAGLAQEQPLDIEITGDFDGFYQFLLDIEQLPRITRIPDFSILRSDKVDGEMKTKLVLSVYYQGDGSESK